MAFLQKRFCNKAEVKPPKVSCSVQEPDGGIIFKNSGFVSLLFLPLTALMMTGFLGIASLSLGIKNITRAQSECARVNLKGQKELGLMLAKILKLNSRSKTLQKSRQVVETALLSALLVGQISLANNLRKKREFIKKAQKLLIIQQKQVVIQSEMLKRKTLAYLKNRLKKLKISNVQEKTFYKKALAIQRQKIGDQAYIYKPVPDFVNNQKTRFDWEMRPFASLEKALLWFLPTSAKLSSNYTCSASLQKKGKKWSSILYH